MKVTNLHGEGLGAPNFLPPDFDAILPELKAIPNWVLAKAVIRDGKLTKPPYQPNGNLASVTDSSTWSSFDQVREAYEAGDGFIGIGFVLDGKPHINGKYLHGFDWDKCINGTIDQQAKKCLLDLSMPRLERSISGTGIRGFFLHDIPLPSRRSTINGMSVELYSDKRYLTTTGDGKGGIGEEANIEAILSLFPESEHKAPATPCSTISCIQVDPSLIETVALKVRKEAPDLWEGNWRNDADRPFVRSYGSQSEADLALARHISSACVREGVSNDQLYATVEAIFGRSELANRDKWQTRADYRESTIGLAIENSAGREPDDSHGDVRNARIFAQQWRDKMLFVASTGNWLRWDNQQWIWCEKEEDVKCAKATVSYLLQAAHEVFKSDQDRGKRLIQQAMVSHNLPRLEAMLKLAKSEPGMTATVNELDDDHWLLGVKNGVVDLRTGGLIPNTPALKITRHCNANHNDGAQCSHWLTFLDQIFESDTETIETIQRALGYTLTGSVTEEKMFICFGHGSNGKSVFNNVIAAIIGGYGRMAPSTLLTARRSDDSNPRNDLASIAGSRYVSINELQAGDKLDEQIVKQLAGRELISARFLHKEFFEYMPTFKAWLRTNHKPIITGEDDGIWRRLVLIPFQRKFTEKEKDPYLEEKLLEERDGILMWMIEGALKWKRDGLKLSAKIKAEHTSYRNECDLLGEFLSEQCQLDPNYKTEQSQAFQQWRTWCDANGIKHNAKASFTRRLAERGFKESKSNGRRYYSGLKLNSPIFAQGG